MPRNLYLSRPDDVEGTTTVHYSIFKFGIRRLQMPPPPPPRRVHVRTYVRNTWRHISVARLKIAIERARRLAGHEIAARRLRRRWCVLAGISVHIDTKELDNWKEDNNGAGLTCPLMAVTLFKRSSEHQKVADTASTCIASPQVLR